MAELISTETLEDGNIRRSYSDGRIQIVDPTSGKIVSNHIPPEVAASMGKIARDRAANRTDTVESLLSEAGYSENDAPEHVRLLARMACDSVSALRDFRKLTGLEKPAMEAISVQLGERCPVCKQVYYHIRSEVAEQLLDLLEKRAQAKDAAK